MNRRQRERYIRRTVIVLLMGILIFLIVAFYPPHVIRAIVRGRTVSSTLPTFAGETPAASRDCLPPWDVITSPDYMTLPTGSAWDTDGVLMYDYGHDYFRAGWQYSPRTVAVYGMTALQAWCQHGDEVGLRLALRQGDYLVQTGIEVADSIIWLYDFPNEPWNAPAGWASGLGNGFVIALLTQLHSVTGNTEYLAAAAAGVRAYDLTVDESGLRYVDNDGSVWFEEVAHPDAIPGHIINGHIFALFGLDYFADHTNDQLAARLRDEGIAAVRANIHKFDGGNGMLYDLLHRNVLDVHHYHHGINVRGLYWIASQTGDEYFRYWADRYARMVTAFG